MVCAVCVGVGGCAGGGPQRGVSACGLSRETEREERVSLSLLLFCALSLFLSVS
eukprot:COSAG06_NODE_68765_length_204_cov_156.580952_1_plen_53_part_01